MSGAKRLFIPGPVDVRDDVLQCMSAPMIGHRGGEFKELFRQTLEKLRLVMQTEGACIISTSSGSGLMEAAIRNCVGKRVLNTVCGAFSGKWRDISVSCGREADALSVEWGRAVKPQMIAERLEGGGYDAVCVTHNETSTGVMNPLPEIAAVVKDHPGTLLLVDVVSSFGGVDVNTGKLGLDFCLASSQKALGLPPGIAVASVSDAALERAAGIPGRGYYFDILELKKNAEKHMTPYTPSISHINALNVQLGFMLGEGLENRFARHRSLASIARKWAKGNGFSLFAESGYESDTVTCIENTLGVDFDRVKAEMAARGYGMDAGYRKLNERLAAEGRPQTFRIAHMGDLQVEGLRSFLDALDDSIGKAG